jgi:hypothetical protein
MRILSGIMLPPGGEKTARREGHASKQAHEHLLPLFLLVAHLRSNQPNQKRAHSPASVPLLGSSSSSSTIPPNPSLPWFAFFSSSLPAPPVLLASLALRLPLLPESPKAFSGSNAGRASPEKAELDCRRSRSDSVKEAEGGAKLEESRTGGRRLTSAMVLRAGEYCSLGKGDGGDGLLDL